MSERTEWNLRPTEGPVTAEDRKVAAQIKARVIARRKG